MIYPFLRLQFLIVLSHWLPSFATAQGNYDANWLISDSNSGGPIKLDFNSTPPGVQLIQVSDLEFAGASMSMSDSLSGQLLFYSNGCKVRNQKHMVMFNGDSISPGYIQQYLCESGSTMQQSMVSIKKPGQNSQYYLFNLDLRSTYGGSSVNPVHVYYHLIDMSLDGGLGAVTEKLKVAVSDTLARGKLQAVKHSNGVDWWLIVPRARSNCYYIWKVDVGGVHPASKICEGSIWTHNDDGQAVFTPDGKKYIRFNAYNGIKIFDFDAENGVLSNEISIDLPNYAEHKYYGTAVSSNSRFLYCSANDSLYQFDLEAAEIGQSKTLVAEWNGTLQPFPTLFSYMSLAPDSKIYIVPPGSSRSLHVINNPDCKGLSCDVKQNAIDFGIAFNYWTIPSFPHYRNQPKVCDTTSAAKPEDSIVIGAEFIQVHPNPTTGKISISIGDTLFDETILSVCLFNLTGGLLYCSNSGDKLHHLDIDAYPNGLYFVRVETHNGTYLHKVMKQ